jgi:hypothetical protein
LNDENFGGYSTDWRLPNKNELLSLFDPGKSSAPYSNFPEMESASFFSSTTILYSDTLFFPGLGGEAHFYLNFGSTSSSESGYFRCVR